MLDWVVERIDASIRDFSMAPISGARFLAYLGTVSLALLVVAYFDPERRRQLRSVALPGNAVDPLRAAGVLAVGALAFFPVARSFTGPLEFGIARSVGSLFPGFPTTGDVENLVVDAALAAYGSDAETDLLECEYFLPQAGPPPLWHCSVKVTPRGEPPQYHDNLQITGRRDGTFDCFDGSQADLLLC